MDIKQERVEGMRDGFGECASAVGRKRAIESERLERVGEKAQADGVVVGDEDARARHVGSFRGGVAAEWAGMRLSSNPMVICVAAFGLGIAPPSVARTLRIDASRVDAPAVSLAGLHAEAQLDEDKGSLRIEAARLQVPDAALDGRVGWKCDLRRDGDAQVCEGPIRVGGSREAILSARVTRDAVELCLDVRPLRDAKLASCLAHDSQLDVAPGSFFRRVLEPLLEEEWFVVTAGKPFAPGATDPFAGL